MEWQQLLGFYQTAKLGSFTKAAEATFRTQSALTQQVKALEEELQCRLFERLGRQVRLTQAGEKLFKFAEETFARYEHLKEEMQDLLGRPGGRLRLAAPFTTLYHLLPATIKEYARRFPHVELTILDRPQGQVIRLVQSGDIDFGLVLEAAAPKNLVRTRWRRVRTAIMVPEGHPLTRTERVSLEAIARHPLILPPRSLEYSGRERLEDMFRQENLRYQVVMESANVELSALYVSLGLGLAFATISGDRLSLKPENIVFLPLDHYFQTGHIVLITKPAREIAAYKQAFIQLLLGEGDSEADPLP
ncbi:MAG: LysR family transcriptional regulator [Deltaproteobacteria bacterium]|nr:LysR family transcriptional regulator [Deltaproteobacteria bacterium]